MRNLDELYPARYLKPEDLQGKAVRVWVEDVSLTPLFNPRTGKEEQKLVVTFMDKTKKLVLNKTQALALADVADTNTWALWVGREVRLRPGLSANRKPTILIEAPTAPMPQPHQDPFAEGE